MKRNEIITYGMLVAISNGTAMERSSVFTRPFETIATSMHLAVSNGRRGRSVLVIGGSLVSI